jgi:hypothetical protein
MPNSYNDFLDAGAPLDGSCEPRAVGTAERGGAYKTDFDDLKVHLSLPTPPRGDLNQVGQAKVTPLAFPPAEQQAGPQARSPGQIVWFERYKPTNEIMIATLNLWRWLE